MAGGARAPGTHVAPGPSLRTRPSTSPRPRGLGAQAGGGQGRSSPRPGAGRAAPGRRGVRAGLGVRDGCPGPHARRAVPAPPHGGGFAGHPAPGRRGEPRSGARPAPDADPGRSGGPQPRLPPNNAPRAPPLLRRAGGLGATPLPSDSAAGQWRAGVEEAGPGWPVGGASGAGQEVGAGCAETRSGHSGRAGLSLLTLALVSAAPSASPLRFGVQRPGEDSGPGDNC